MLRALSVFLLLAPALIGSAPAPERAYSAPTCWALRAVDGTVTYDHDARCYTWENPIKILHGATEHHNTAAQSAAYRKRN